MNRFYSSGLFFLLFISLAVLIILFSSSAYSENTVSDDFTVTVPPDGAVLNTSEAFHARIEYVSDEIQNLTVVFTVVNESGYEITQYDSNADNGTFFDIMSNFTEQLPAGRVTVNFVIYNNTSILYDKNYTYIIKRKLTADILMPKYVDAGTDFKVHCEIFADYNFSSSSGGYLLWKGNNISFSSTHTLNTFLHTNGISAGPYKLMLHLNGDAYNLSTNIISYVTVREKVNISTEVERKAIFPGEYFNLSGSIEKTVSGYSIPYTKNPEVVMALNDTEMKYPWTVVDYLNSFGTYHYVNISLSAIFPANYTINITRTRYLGSDGNFSFSELINPASPGMYIARITFPAVYYFSETEKILYFNVTVNDTMTVEKIPVSKAGDNITISGVLQSTYGYDYAGNSILGPAYYIDNGKILYSLPINLVYNGGVVSSSYTSTDGTFSLTFTIPQDARNNITLTAIYGGDVFHSPVYANITVALKSPTILKVIAFQSGSTIYIEGWLNSSDTGTGINGRFIQVRFGGNNGTIVEADTYITTGYSPVYGTYGYFSAFYTMSYIMIRPVEIYAMFTGDSSYSYSEDSYTCFMSDKTSIYGFEAITDYPGRAVSGKAFALHGYLYDTLGNGVGNVNISVYIDGKYYTSTLTATSGFWNAIVVIKLTGLHTITVKSAEKYYYIYGDLESDYIYSTDYEGEYWNNHSYKTSYVMYNSSIYHYNISCWYEFGISLFKNEYYSPGYITVTGNISGNHNESSRIIRIKYDGTIYTGKTDENGNFSIYIYMCPHNPGDIHFNVSVMPDYSSYMFSDWKDFNVTVKFPTKIMITSYTRIENRYVINIFLRDNAPSSLKGVGGAFVTYEYEDRIGTAITGEDGATLFYVYTNRTFGYINCRIAYGGGKYYQASENMFKLTIKIKAPNILYDSIPYMAVIIIFSYLALLMGRKSSKNIMGNDIRHILKSTIRRLRLNNPYSIVILEMYAKLAEILRRRGVIREDAETFKEFSEGIKRVMSGVNEKSVDTLLEIIEEIIYSKHRIGKEHKNAAIAAFRDILSSMTISGVERGNPSVIKERGEPEEE